MKIQNNSRRLELRIWGYRTIQGDQNQGERDIEQFKEIGTQDRGDIEQFKKIRTQDMVISNNSRRLELRRERYRTIQGDQNLGYGYIEQFKEIRTKERGIQNNSRRLEPRRGEYRTFLRRLELRRGGYRTLQGDQN